jgi:hypothetical protein
MLSFKTMLLAVFAAVVSVSCGGSGSGGGGQGGSPIEPVTVSGYVLVGPVQGATVQLFSIDRSGNKAFLAQSTSALDGSFSFKIAPPANTGFMVSALGGTYLDPATGVKLNLNSVLRGIGVWLGQPQRVTLTGYSEAMVRTLESAQPFDWSVAAIGSVEVKFKAWMKLSTVQNFQPIDLQTTGSFSSVTGDISSSLMAGGFSYFARRLDSNPTTTLASAIDRLYYLVSLDNRDDRLFPAFAAGYVEFVDASSLTLDVKRRLRSNVIFGRDGYDSLPGENLPAGVSSGSAIAPMGDGPFRVLFSSGTQATFNKRGALISYGSSPPALADSTDLHTASVAEMYADGDVGIGRWNGGAYSRVSEVLAPSGSGTQSISFVDLLTASRGLQYAVAKSPSGIPSCGTRQFALVAATEPSLKYSADADRSIAGLTPDSVVSVQYGNGLRIGVDLGVRLANGSTVRYTTRGGAIAPWASQVIASGDASFGIPVSSVANGPQPALNLDLAALVSGQGASKIVVNLQASSLGNLTEMSAVFAGTAGALDVSNCTLTGGSGSGISPLPSNGLYNVNWSFSENSRVLGPPTETTFGSVGELRMVAGPVTISTPVFDLAGNADASIGRITVTGTQNGPRIPQVMPYAAVRPGATLPTSGTVVYELIASTGVTVDQGDSNKGMPTGTVSSASLSITYGQYPLGQANVNNGTPQFSVKGTIGGVPFSVNSPTNPGAPLSGLISPNGKFFDNNDPIFISFPGLSTPAGYGRIYYSGAVGAPDGTYAAVYFTALAAGTPVNGSLLFKKR